MEPRTMTTVLDGVASWVRAAIAPKLEYLVPPDDGRVEGYDAVTAHPSVYQAFVPSKERLAEGDVQAPSISVQLIGGTDSIESPRTLSIRFVLSIWAPGHFDAKGFHRSQDGWRDLYNGIEAITAAIEAAETIAGCAVDRNRGVHYGFLDIDGEIPDLYPYWLGKVDFDLIGAPPHKNRFKRLL